MGSNLSRFLAELKRRRVTRVAVVYAIVGLGVIEAASMILPVLQLEAANPYVVILVLFGFPVALVLAWALEVTPDGIQRTTDLVPGEAGPTPSQGRDTRSWLLAGLGFVVVLVGGYFAFLRGDAPGPIDRIAVLPPENLTGDPEQDFFAAGMHEQLITVLGQVLGTEVDVIGRRSVMRFQGSQQTIPEIATELSVDAVVETSLFRSGDSAVISARLTRAVAERQMWGETYGGDLEDIGHIYQDVARDIAGEIQVALSPTAVALAEHVRTVDPEAYDHYLRGRLYQNRLLEIEPDLYRAISHFRRSLEEDPSFAPAHARIALAFATLGAFNIVSPDSAWPNMERAVERAIELDPRSPEAQLALGVARYQRWRWREAEEAFSAVLKANPNDVDALHWYALYHQLHMNPDQAVALVNRAASLEPEDPWTMGRMAWPLLGMGRWDEGVDILQAVLDDYPDYGLGYWNLSLGLTGRGDIEDALKAIQSAISLMEPDDLGDEYGVLGYLLARVGRTEEAREQLDNLDRLESTGRFVSPVSRSLVYAGLGDDERALDLLEEGFENRSGWLHFAMNAPYWAHLHSHPRYIQLRQQLGLPPRN